MKIYRCVKRFMCTPLGIFLPVGARIARYENVTKIVIDDAPRTDQDPFSVLADGFIYTAPGTVTWFYAVEPAPLGTSNAGFFILIGSAQEDQFGNVGAGLPTNGKMQISTDGTMYMQNMTTNLWHPVRINGPDGAVFLEIGQNGVTPVP